jgi:hypothetical protein
LADGWFYLLWFAMQEKAQQLRYSICEHIDTLDIPGYLADEAKKFLEYVNYYKLKNIYKHVTLFCDFLLYLDGLYTNQLQAMLLDAKQTSSVVEAIMTEDDNRYFLSASTKQQLIDWDLYVVWSETWFDRYQLLSVIMRIKGLLLLSGTEFCHASTTRLSLYTRVFHREGE